MKHLAHKHSLLLNENFISREGDVCFVCKDKIISCKSFVYSCSSSITNSSITNNSSTAAIGDDNCDECVKFLLHKNCAELPPTIQTRTNPKQLFELKYGKPVEKDECKNCISCWRPFYSRGDILYYYSNGSGLCTRCALIQVESNSEVVHQFQHPAHTQHGPLALVSRPSSFKCDACNVEDIYCRDLSYRCTKCQFWMHKTCADAPTSFHFLCHDKHPLILTFSLPPKYFAKYVQDCKLCRKAVTQLCWLYYCPNCRFFAHFQCARSDQSSLRSTSEDEYDSNIVQLPPADESMVDVLFEQFVKAMSTLNQDDDDDDDDDDSNIATISKTSTSTSTNHWAHSEHPLQLITMNELNDGDEMLLLCDGCAKPIRRTNGDDQFYGCVPCNFFMHRVCAEFLGKIKHSCGKLSKPYELFRCAGCLEYCSGIYFWIGSDTLHIGCFALPEIIKHEGHRHQLYRLQCRSARLCRICMVVDAFAWYKCQKCDFYICCGCIMRPRRVKHGWDPHPLSLIYDPSMVSDHEHDYECERCSEDIDPNFWFYHCSDCDLSFHLRCLQYSSYSGYSNVKVGATDINIDKLHPHSLTFMLNKKFATCKRCDESVIGEPMLHCVPCKAMFCMRYKCATSWY